MRNGVLGGLGIIAVTSVGYWLAGWNGALSAFLGFAVGGVVATKQMMWKLRAMRDENPDPP